MKTVAISLALAATIAASTSDQVVHTDHGSIDARSQVHVNDYEECIVSYLEYRAPTDRQKANATRQRERRDFAFTALVGSVALGHEVQTNDPSVRYVDACMTERGWIEW